MSEIDKKNIPEVRFDGFDKEWEKKTFQDLYKTASEGGTPDTTKKEYYENGEIPFVKIEDTEQKYITNTEAHITQEGVDNSSAWVVPKDSVIFTNGATVGNVAINKIPVTTKQGILGVVPNESVDTEFLYNSLSTSHFQNEIKRREAKGTFATITLKNMNEIEVLNTSLEEQKKIAEFFKQLDRLIELNEQKVEKLEALKKSLLEKMFPVGGATTPQIRFIGFSDEWTTQTLSDIATFFRGNGYSKTDLIDEGSPIVLYGRLYTKYETEIKSVDTFVKAKENSIYSTGKEVLVPSSGETAEDIARASHIAQPNVLLGGDLNVLLPNSNVDSNFLAFSISNGEPQKELSKKAQGKSVVHIHNEDIETLNIPLPTTNEQSFISKLLLNVIQEIDTYTQKIEKFRNLKIAFLDKMIPHTHTHTRIPQIRFKEFVGEWKSVELGDLCSITTGSLDANAENPNGKYAFFTCNKNSSRTDTFAFDGDAILVSGNGNVGHTNLYSGKFNAYQRTYVLMDFTENHLFTKLIIDKYLPEKLTKEIFGGCIPYIKLDTLKKLKVMLP